MLNSRLSQLPDYPFDRLRGLLDVHVPPNGLRTISMSLGEPQHSYPDIVERVLSQNSSLFGKYPPAAGPFEFRSAIVDWLGQRYGLPEGILDADRHVASCSGTREALFRAALVAVPPEKYGKPPLVLIPNPFYQCYAGAAVAAGGKPVYLPATSETGFLPDFSNVCEDTLQRTALVYLCTPSNPQGSVASLSYLKHVLELAQQFDFVVFVDECYAEIYSEKAPPGALEASTQIDEDFSNVLVFHSLSKRSNVPGLRSGFVAGDADLLGLYRRLTEYGGSPSPLPIYAVATALWRDEDHVRLNRRLYSQKFNMAAEILEGKYSFYRPDGGFFLWLDVEDGESAALELWAKAGVRVLPGAFLSVDDPPQSNPGSRYIRVAMVNETEVTLEALHRIRDTL